MFQLIINYLKIINICFGLIFNIFYIFRFDIYKHLNSELYINPTGGHDLYSKQDFSDNGVVLSFLEPVLEEYDQNSTSFEPGLSIIDVMMMNSRTEVKRMLNSYKII